MRHKISADLKRETFTGRLDPKTLTFLRRIPGSNGRKIDYLVGIVKPLVNTLRDINERLAIVRAPEPPAAPPRP